jgi:hypothetical protein
VDAIYETFDFPWCVFQSLQGKDHFYNPYYRMWKLNVQASTHILHEFEDDELKWAFCEN